MSGYDSEYAEFALLGLNVRADKMPATLEEVFGDGINYSDKIHWQSPEGLFYGQTAIVRRYYIPIVWTGTNYLRMQSVQVAINFSDLPSVGMFDFQLVKVRKAGATWEMQQQGKAWDFYFWNTITQQWQLIEWLWTIEDVRNIPYPGIGIGKAHLFVKHHQQFLWDGYKYIEWPSHFGLFDDEPDRHLPEGFITNYEDQISDTHGRIMHVDSLLSSHALANELAFDGVYFDLDDIDDDIADVSNELEDVQQDVANFSSDGYITLAEANALNANKEELVAESEDLVEWADALNIVTAKSNYQSSLSILVNTLAVWVSNPPYPKAITGAQRTSITNAINDLSNKKQILVKALSDATADGLTTTFLSRVSEAIVEFKSKTNIGMFGSIKGSHGAIWCSGELLLADSSDDVTNEYPVLNYVNGAIVPIHIEPNTEYYVYIANYKSSQFNVAGLPASGDKPATQPRDFRGNLFLSLTPDYNGTLGETAPGLNARVVGKCETDGTDYSEGGPYFIREINMSIIGRNVDLSQAFTEYSDYQLSFVDQDTLAFNKFDGTRGLIYIAGQLLELGNGLEVDTNDYRVTWNGGYAEPMSLDMTAIAPDTTYAIYIANDEDSYNFNLINPGTGRPYQESDIGYVAAKDKRRQLFLSTKVHDHRLFDEAYPGYFARHVGQIQTDANGRFKYAADVSLIRQLTLNPTHLDGLAECVIQDVSTTQFKVIRKKGTTGIVYVGGKPVQTYDADNPLVHVVTTSDALYEYDETEIDAPLTDSGLIVSDKPGISLYLYMANDIDAWDGITTFCSLEAPHGGYLSTNWPGNQARWIATIQLSPDTLGTEKVANGGFATDTSWTKGTGWSYDAGDQNMLHTVGNSASLSQDVSAVAGELYACTFYITGRTAGIAAPKIGGTSGQSISGNTSSTQYLLASTTGNLEIVPDTYFDGSVDNVSVKKVVAGKFSGTYIKDSVSGVSAQIDDSIVSTGTTYSSNKIEQIRQQLLGKINLALGLNGSHTAGLDLQLEYVNSTTIKLKASTSDIDVVFPNLDTVTVTTTGITKTVVGSTNTLYYVYLVTDGSLAITTNAPTDVYSSISFYGETHVLVGWMGFSATNTIEGTHNVYSYWNEPARSYTQSTTSINSATLALNGFVLITGKTATVGWSGSIQGTSSVRADCEYAPWSYYDSVSLTSTSLGTSSYTKNCFPYYQYGPIPVTRTHVISLSSSTVATGVSSVSIYLTATASVSPSSTEGMVICYIINEGNTWNSISGTITLTRPGS